MADQKITDLTSYTTPIGTDVFPIVDVTGVATKKITRDNLAKNVLNLMAYADMSANANTTATVIAVQNQWYQVTVFSSNGQNNLATPDHTNDHITVTNTGIYKVDASISLTGVSNNKTYELQIKKNNGAVSFNNTTSGLKTSTTTVRRNVSVTGIINLTAADTVELWIRCTDATTANVTCRFLNLNLIQIGR